MRRQLIWSMLVAAGLAPWSGCSSVPKSGDATQTLSPTDRNLKVARPPAAEPSMWDKLTGGKSDPAKEKAERHEEVVRGANPTNLDKPASNPTSLYVAMAQTHEQAGHTKDAERLFQKAIKDSPKDLEARLGYARMLDRLKRYDEAVANYKEAIKQHPASATARNDFGLCLARQNRLSDAVVELKKAVELDSKRPLYRNNLATVMVDQGKSNDALAVLQAGLPPAAAHYNIGYLLMQKSRPHEAREQFALALKHDPSLTQASDYFAQLGGAPDQIAAAEAPTEPTAPTEVQISIPRGPKAVSHDAPTASVAMAPRRSMSAPPTFVEPDTLLSPERLPPVEGDEFFPRSRY